MKYTGFFNDLPPSANNMYYNRPGGGRGLTTEAKNYKRRLADALMIELLPHTTSFVTDIPYDIRMLLVMPADEVVNKTFGQVVTRGARKGLPKKGSAKTRFTKMDVDNRAKLLLDAISLAIGVDDSCNFSVTAMKCIGEQPGVWLSIEPLLVDPDDLDYFLARL